MGRMQNPGTLEQESLAHLSKNPGHLSKISGSGPNLLVLFAENCCGGQTVVARHCPRLQRHRRPVGR